MYAITIRIHCLLPSRQLRNASDATADVVKGLLPSRQLRKFANDISETALGLLPSRQLRNLN